MKLNQILATSVIVFTNPVLAWDSYDSEPYDQYGQPNYRYESISGQRYQYDLSETIDREMYKSDYGAQWRDKTYFNPYVDTDRGLGQYGGGAE